MAKSTEWLKKVDGWIDRLTGEIDAVKASELFKRHLDTVARFWSYSFHNSILIMLQRDDATWVAGYRKWQGMKRQVRKGEKGIKILAPGMRKANEEKVENGADSDERRLTYFFPVTVFDVSQTDGEELPLMDGVIEGDDGEGLFNVLHSHMSERGIDVKFEAMGEGTFGASRKGEVAISDSASWNNRCSTLIHEYAHELLHWDGMMETRQRKEAEAEAVAYIVLSHYGLPTKAPKYLAVWSADKELLTGSLSVIAATSKQIIGGIENCLEQVA